ncbi:MAG: cryptochrome/photolyase family protein [Verrucomicrobiota bacterium]
MARTCSGEISLVFPHQLFEKHPALKEGRTVYLIEDTLFFGDPHAAPGRFHRQKIMLHRASMKAYEVSLAKRGFEVIYIDYDRETPIDSLLATLCEDNPFKTAFVSDPSDFLLEKRIHRAAGHAGFKVEFVESPMFLTPMEWAKEHFDGRKRPFMAKFYEEQRKRMGLLVDEQGEPEGGQWSFDEDNRKPMPKRGLHTPQDLTVPRREWVDEAEAYVDKHFSDYPGQTYRFDYPVTVEDARAWLNQFFEDRFAQFGPFEDAISENERTLFHSLLTPALNIGLLTPDEVIEGALDYASKHKVPIQSLEGFVRQIVGWREFIHIMYRRHGVEMRNGNHFNHTRGLPDAFWVAETGLEPVDMILTRVIETGYAHHIERLMVLGNLMLLGEFHPNEVYSWFMEFFIDAYDWVMVPNVYGMSQFADGGIFSTKPYISGSNYLKKMSDYTTGEWCETWDGLFWRFISQHEDFFRSQYRLKMMVSNLTRMGPEKLEAHHQNASDFWSRIGS